MVFLKSSIVTMLLHFLNFRWKCSSRISYDTSTLPQCTPNEGLDAIMRCRRCCIDNMFRILNNDSEAVLRGITKQRTLECSSRRVRTLEKSIWTRGTPPYPWTLLWTPFFLSRVTMSSSHSCHLRRHFSVPLQLRHPCSQCYSTTKWFA